MDNEKGIIIEVLCEMIKDYLYYGYSKQFFLDQKYKIMNYFSEKEFNALWKKCVYEMKNL